MRRLFSGILCVSALASIPLVASADECRYQAPRNLNLDLAGVHSVQIQLHSQELHLHSGKADPLVLNGKACASDPKLLDGLVVTQRREGDRVYLEAVDRNEGHFGSAGLDLDLQLPIAMPVELDVGSGDAEVMDIQQLRAHVGSGDLHITGLAGDVQLSVGSGEAVLKDIGSLTAGSVGSGSLKVDGVHGDVQLRSLGSGEVELRHVGGSVSAQTVGSGSLDVDGVRGGLSVGAVGSGDVSHHNVSGKVDVPHDD